MNRLPELKDFIKYGGAESYENVQIEYSRGRKAVLTIFHDGEVHEQVELQTISTQKEMHQMMLDKGFVRKSEGEVERIRLEGKRREVVDAGDKQRAEEDMQKKKQRIIEEQRHRAETFHGSTKGDEFTKLAQRIKELKAQGGNEEQVKDLEQRRLQLVREEMLARQYQLQNAGTKNQENPIGNDEL